QPVLGPDVRVEPVEVLLGEELSGEEARTAQALEQATAGAGWGADRRRRWCGRGRSHRPGRGVTTGVEAGVEVVGHGCLRRLLAVSLREREPAVELPALDAEQLRGITGLPAAGH